MIPCFNGLKLLDWFAPPTPVLARDCPATVPYDSGKPKMNVQSTTKHPHTTVDEAENNSRELVSGKIEVLATPTNSSILGAREIPSTPPIPLQGSMPGLASDHGSPNAVNDSPATPVANRPSSAFSISKAFPLATQDSAASCMAIKSSCVPSCASTTPSFDPTAWGNPQENDLDFNIMYPTNAILLLDFTFEDEPRLVRRQVYCADKAHSSDVVTETALVTALTHNFVSKSVASSMVRYWDIPVVNCGSSRMFVMTYCYGSLHKYLEDEGWVLREKAKVKLCHDLLVAMDNLSRLTSSVLDTAQVDRFIATDIKPDNILMTFEGELKLADLGMFTRIESPDTGYLHNPVGGTNGWASPELQRRLFFTGQHAPQLECCEELFDGAYLNESSELFALGLICLAIMLGCPHPHLEVFDARWLYTHNAKTDRQYLHFLTEMADFEHITAEAGWYFSPGMTAFFDGVFAKPRERITRRKAFALLNAELLRLDDEEEAKSC
ncbi:hypothetical protein P7C73_g3439, partial [Tremellales sp. Uapishka_1]